MWLRATALGVLVFLVNVVKTAMKPSANSIGVSKWMFPRHVVASQLKILTPVGTATAIEVAMKKTCSPQGSPTANMWCAHTSMDTNAMPTVESMIAV